MGMSVVYTVVDDEIISETRTGVELDYLPSSPGSTSALTDAGQHVVARWTYWPFGEVSFSSGSSITPFKFIGTLGYATDSPNDRYYVRARFYRPHITRWQTVDEAWPYQSAYGYVGGNPVNRVDPSGLWFFHSPDCDAGQIAQLRQAFTLLCCKLRPRMYSCLTSISVGIGGTATCTGWPKGTATMADFFDFVCDDTTATCPINISCKHGLGCRGRDGLTVAKGLGNTISLCPSAFESMAAGPLYCIIAHELIHLSSGAAHGKGGFACLGADPVCGGIGFNDT